MSRNFTNAISAGLIGTGALAWAFAGRPLVANPDLRTPLNPLGINHSPYGQVFAMAMQGPIDTYFSGSQYGGVHKHDDAARKATESTQEEKAKAADVPLGSRLQKLITSLDNASTERTNPKPASNAQRLYLRRQVEDKLRFAYQLDPSHYGNYNSLHFFLTEPQMGTRPELTPSALQLADETIQYCLNQKNDPRPILTAAGACTNVLQLMFADRQNPLPKYDTTQMRSYLNLLDQCIHKYETAAEDWKQSKNWELLSPMRINECNERYDFICKIRDASEKAIVIFESKQHSQASN
ncbi:MAG: hypothetical protein ABIT37_22890 [Luteolibacter sp.]